MTNNIALTKFKFKMQQLTFMQNSEQEIAIIKDIHSMDTSRDYILHLTTKRFVLIHFTDLDAQAAKAQVTGGLIGWAIAKGVQKANESKRKKKEDVSQGLTLDELLQKDKKSFAMAHENIVSIRLHKGWTNGEIFVQLKSSQARLSVDKKQIELISAILAQVTALQGKVIVK